MLELGIKAPDFELPDQNGEVHKLSLIHILLLENWKFLIWMTFFPCMQNPE